MKKSELKYEKQIANAKIIYTILFTLGFGCIAASLLTYMESKFVITGITIVAGIACICFGVRYLFLAKDYENRD